MGSVMTFFCQLESRPCRRVLSCVIRFKKIFDFLLTGPVNWWIELSSNPPTIPCHMKMTHIRILLLLVLQFIPLSFLPLSHPPPSRNVSSCHQFHRTSLFSLSRSTQRPIHSSVVGHCHSSFCNSRLPPPGNQFYNCTPIRDIDWETDKRIRQLFTWDGRGLLWIETPLLLRLAGCASVLSSRFHEHCVSFICNWIFRFNSGLTELWFSISI